MNCKKEFFPDGSGQIGYGVRGGAGSFSYYSSQYDCLMAPVRNATYPPSFLCGFIVGVIALFVMPRLFVNPAAPQAGESSNG